MTDVVLGCFGWKETLCTSLWARRQLIYGFFFWRCGAVVGGGLCCPLHVLAGGNLPVLPNSLPFIHHLLDVGSVGYHHTASSPRLPRQRMSLPARHRLRHAGCPPASSGRVLCACPLRARPGSHPAPTVVQHHPSHRPRGWHTVAVLRLLPGHLQHVWTAARATASRGRRASRRRILPWDGARGWASVQACLWRGRNKDFTAS